MSIKFSLAYLLDSLLAYSTQVWQENYILLFQTCKVLLTLLDQILLIQRVTAVCDEGENIFFEPVGIM